jgi:hypothetical protein
MYVQYDYCNSASNMRSICTFFSYVAVFIHSSRIRAKENRYIIKEFFNRVVYPPRSSIYGIIFSVSRGQCLKNVRRIVASSFKFTRLLVLTSVLFQKQLRRSIKFSVVISSLIPVS